MKTYVQEGNLVFLTMPAARNAGEGVLVGDTFGVCEETIANGVRGPVRTSGVFTLPKATGLSIAEGALCYWDNAARNVTNVSAGNRRIGSAMAATVNGDTSITVRLAGIPVPTGA